jgi:hypothetical protein
MNRTFKATGTAPRLRLRPHQCLPQQLRFESVSRASQHSALVRYTQLASTTFGDFGRERTISIAPRSHGVMSARNDKLFASSSRRCDTAG